MGSRSLAVSSHSDPHDEPLQHGSLRSPRDGHVDRLARDGAGSGVESDPESIVVTGGSNRGSTDAVVASGALPDLNVHPAGGSSEAILIMRDQQLPFGLSVTGVLNDLHVTGRPTRAIPRRRA